MLRLCYGNAAIIHHGSFTICTAGPVRSTGDRARRTTKGVINIMMSTILTLIILGMVFQGVMAVVNSILDTVGVNSMLSSIPVVGSNLNLIWAYLFVAISDLGGWGYAASTDILGMGDFGADLGSALAICAFIPVKDAALSALSKGVAR